MSSAILHVTPCKFSWILFVCQCSVQGSGKLLGIALKVIQGKHWKKYRWASRGHSFLWTFDGDLKPRNDWPLKSLATFLNSMWLNSSVLDKFPSHCLSTISHLITPYQLWVNYIIVLDSWFTELVWCIRTNEILSKSTNPASRFSWLAQLHQGRSIEHRKVFESKTNHVIDPALPPISE